ncbi:hypothetical protein DRQ09_08240, partial [candidate division KSB1 bacterium]
IKNELTGFNRRVNIIPYSLYKQKGSKISMEDDSIQIPLILYKKLKHILNRSFFIKHKIPDVKVCSIPYSSDFGLVLPVDSMADKYLI